MTGILKVDQWKDSGDNALMTSDGAGNLTSNTEITVKSTTDTPSIVVNNTNDGKARMTFQENGTNRLEIGLYGGIVSGTSGSTAIKAHEALTFHDNSGESFRSQSGQILLGTTQEGSAAAGDVVLGGGIFIGGNATANKLDDYEEGTWTPQLYAGTSAATGVTYTYQEGYYQKIGNWCTLKCRVAVSAKGSSSGTAGMGNLPFDPADDYGAVNFENPGSPMYSDLQNLNSRIINSAFVHVGNKAVYFAMQGTSDTNNFSLLEMSQCTDLTDLRAVVIYKTV